VATFNIHHGRVGAHWPCLPWRLRAGIRLLDADLIALQEVDRRVVRSWFVDLAELARQAARAGAVTFARARWFGPGGQYGNALVSRGTIGAVDVVHLPVGGGREPRLAIVARAEVAGERVVVVSTHLQTKRSEAIEQLHFLVARLAEEQGPVLLCGDFNLHPDDVAPIVAAGGFELAGGANSSGVDHPWHRIDHIAVRGGTILAVDVPRPPVSDHRPVIATVRVAGRSAAPSVCSGP
jgi:endonuclease/exonuclease/phosphatase family metal-dependent hydrolase